MRGVFTALITPFETSGKLDLPAFRKIVRDQIAAGVSGVIPCGTTGESPTLSTDEKKLLISTCLKETSGTPVRVVAGTGGNATEETIALSRWASEAGAAGVLIVTPYYNKPSQAGLSAHFRAVADAVSCEVILYNVPGRTGVSLTAATVAELATHPRLRTIKEATGNVAFTSEILDALAWKERQMDILSGDDATYLPLLSVGAKGVISVASNLFPRAMVALQAAWDSGKPAEARAIHERFFPLFRDLFVESNPGPIKHAMARAGWCGSGLRPPLAPLAEPSARTLEASLEHCGIRKGMPL
jgi:4-hydroxy-tetrahydrodipicolinate synthase